MENFSQALGSDTAMGTHHIVWDAQSGCTVNKDTVAVSWFARGHQSPFVFISSLLWLPVCGHITSRSSWTFGCKFAPVWCSWLLSFFLPCPALVPGLALMSSTALISRCCLWWPSRSPPSRKHSSRGYVRNLWMQKQAKKKSPLELLWASPCLCIHLQASLLRGDPNRHPWGEVWTMS